MAFVILLVYLIVALVGWFYLMKVFPRDPREPRGENY